ncbi:hypothetical protein ATANTOWER_010083, partial [Ataeniobius toweri]|nr:hypothetical protein [Ataeniobius toweri]
MHRPKTPVTYPPGPEPHPSQPGPKPGDDTPQEPRAPIPVGAVGAEGSGWSGVSHVVISWRTIRGRRASTSMPECFAPSWLPKSRSKLRDLSGEPSNSEHCPPSSVPPKTAQLRRLSVARCLLQDHNLSPWRTSLSLADQPDPAQKILFPVPGPENKAPETLLCFSCFSA